ncbi:response regulator [Pseudomonas panipatensis]|jgi:DNA-binding response OmpR family regulator|uniref:Two-component system, OmpR family, response regulator BasR n=1 Tax=Pseudomonas panipatensis TaxID=428992 RepID=A0A1G8BFE7_9PSED|nr:response regulator [Pseudomonas panipatensis]SDH31966.1 two-component system, OmpR family, response regulator BasR [Pseudomonas panipatensis]SMP71044.1 two-component system, OmpR family, response regulator BasR [Pseudomonas panipatensis]
MRLLLAEDDAMIGEGLQQGLRKEGYSVDWVQDGKSALLALETTEYALLLLDLGLPRSDGMEVLRRIRRSETALPVIIITARDTLPDRVAGLDCGADDYLVKPFAMEELLARMRAVSRRQAGRAQSELNVGPLRMDPAGHLLWLRGQPVTVSAKEFALLQVLMQGPERILSREQLEDRLYGWGEEVGSNAVQVHIFNLRKKLGAEVIRSVRGVGYHIGEDQ